MPNDSVLLLGGAGFIGSNLAHHFAHRGYKVTVLDGMLPRTGANRRFLAPIADAVEIIEARIENVPSLAELVLRHTVVIDCMGWTRHRWALEDPLHDCRCNVESHLHLLRAVPDSCRTRIIYLGSRGQYGNPKVSAIAEDTPMLPEDVQGAHKLAAEHLYRVYARLKKLSVLSLRFVACFGPNQPVEGDDIGLVGGFIRGALQGKTISIFGEHRRRSVLFIEDLCNVIEKLVQVGFEGFSALNLAGHDVAIKSLAEAIIGTAGKGALQCEPLPDDIAAIDIGAASFVDARLIAKIGELPRTSFERSIAKTVDYFRKHDDLAM